MRPISGPAELLSNMHPYADLSKTNTHAVIGDEIRQSPDPFLQNVVQGISIVGEMVDDLYGVFVQSTHSLQPGNYPLDVGNAHMSSFTGIIICRFFIADLERVSVIIITTLL